MDKNKKETPDATEVSDENLQYLRDIAEKEVSVFCETLHDTLANQLQS